MAKISAKGWTTVAELYEDGKRKVIVQKRCSKKHYRVRYLVKIVDSYLVFGERKASTEEEANRLVSAVVQHYEKRGLKRG